MANWGGAASGAASGAAMGSQIMPGWGTAIGGVAGGLLGLFGGGKKKGGQDINSMFPGVPQLTLQDYDLWLTQIDDLINNWDKIKTGESMFDAEKFIYEPQRTMLEQAYGLGAPGVLAGQNSLGQTNDLFARGGTIPRTLSQMNLTGTLDTGTAGVVRSQAESQMNKDLAGLFGQAKETQRQDYFNSLDQLHSLYPERFQVKNIPNYLAYGNATNQYNADLLKNFGVGGQGAQNAADMTGGIGNLVGGLGSAFSQGGAGSSLLNSIMGLFGGSNGATPKQSPNSINQQNYSISAPWATPQSMWGSPQQMSSATSSSTPEMGGGFDFAKLLKMFSGSGFTGAGASLAR